MTRGEVIARITETGIMPAIRVSSAEDALFGAEAVFRAGIPVVELTMTVPGALGVIANLARSAPQAVIGAGTILDLDTARACLDAGAAFLSSPGLDPEIVAFAVKNGIVVIPGALTPTEVMTASRFGAELIKVFPCAPVGGAAYIKALKAPFPHIHMIASGGVNQNTASDFVRAGAVALGIGEDLIPREAIRLRNADWIRELARRFLEMVKDGRARQTRNHPPAPNDKREISKSRRD